MVVFGQGCCIWAEVIVIGQSGCIRAEECCIRAEVGVFGQGGCYLSKCGCIRAKVVLFGQSGCIRTKKAVFGQRYFSSSKVVDLGKN